MATKYRWWKAPRHRAHAELLPTVRQLERDLGLEERYTEYISELTNREYTGLTPGKMKFSQRAGRRGKKPKGREPMAINMTANIAETLLARICAQNPKPQFLTRRGDYSLRRRAKATDRFVDEGGRRPGERSGEDGAPGAGRGALGRGRRSERDAAPVVSAQVGAFGCARSGLPTARGCDREGRLG